MPTTDYLYLHLNIGEARLMRRGLMRLDSNCSPIHDLEIKRKNNNPTVPAPVQQYWQEYLPSWAIAPGGMKGSLKKISPTSLKRLLVPTNGYASPPLVILANMDILGRYR